MKKWLDLAAAVAMISASGFMIWSSVARPQVAAKSASALRPEPPLTDEPQDIVGFTSIGNRSAPVAVVAYSDFQCPFCARFAREIFPEIKRDYVDTGKIFFQFRHFPLDSIHPYARAAASAAICADRAGQFWGLHDALFRARADKFGPTTVVDEAKRVGLDTPSFRECTMSRDVANQIARDAETGNALGIRGTPSFVLGSRISETQARFTKRLTAVRSAAEFRVAIDGLLSLASGK